MATSNLDNSSQHILDMLQTLPTFNPGNLDAATKLVSDNYNDYMQKKQAASDWFNNANNKLSPYMTAGGASATAANPFAQKAYSSYKDYMTDLGNNYATGIDKLAQQIYNKDFNTSQPALQQSSAQTLPNFNPMNVDSATQMIGNTINNYQQQQQNAANWNNNINAKLAPYMNAGGAAASAANPIAQKAASTYKNYLGNLQNAYGSNADKLTQQLNNTNFSNQQPISASPMVAPVQSTMPMPAKPNLFQQYGKEFIDAARQRGLQAPKDAATRQQMFQSYLKAKGYL